MQVKCSVISFLALCVVELMLFFIGWVNLLMFASTQEFCKSPNKGIDFAMPINHTRYASSVYSSLFGVLHGKEKVIKYPTKQKLPDR